MATFLDVPREFLKALKETLLALLQILVIFKRHPVFSVILIVLTGLYCSGWWLTFAIPQERIQHFFAALQNNADEHAAWNMLDRNYQKNWEHDPDRFESGFQTTVAYSDMRITTKESAWNPFGFLFFNSLSFDVSFIVEDRFSKVDLANPVQQRVNCKWLSIAHPNDYTRLEQGTLGYETLSMKRRYKQIFMMERDSWHNWNISNIQTQEYGLIKPQ
jgi:hypothetical protein